jgi:hypothetical protein
LHFAAICFVGADDFTPLLILAVIRARPTSLGSNLAYIERYRYHSRLVSETHYYYIQLVRPPVFSVLLHLLVLNRLLLPATFCYGCII